MDDRFETFTMAVLRLNKLVQRIKLLEMGGYGLKAIHVMCIYYAAKGPVTAGELSRLTCEDKAAVSRALGDHGAYLGIIVKRDKLQVKVEREERNKAVGERIL